jgi:hypothetical protein
MGATSGAATAYPKGLLEEFKDTKWVIEEEQTTQ